MKRAKLIPSILMLVLCTAVLAVGIYAASPTSHSIVGTVNISAGGANVSITGYLDDGDSNYSNDIKVTDTYTSRTAQTISIYANALDFDCASAFDISEVAEKKLYFKVDNLSSYSLGAYFLEGTVPEGGTTESNIAESKSFNGTMGTQTITNLITATFTPYSEVPANGSTNMYSTLKLNQLNAEASSITLNLNLNIEKFNKELIPNYENMVQVKNSSGANVSVACKLQNASTTSTGTISNSGVWEIGGFAFSEEKFNGQLMLQTIKIKMVVTNNDSVPIAVSISSANTLDSSVLKVTTHGSPYIAPGNTEEVSIQFAAEFDRGTNNSITAVTAPEIPTYSYTVSIAKVDFSSNTLSRVAYDSTGIGNGTMKFYVEFGENPYVENEKLRWFIWAKDDGTGNPEALEPGIDYSGSTFLGGDIYYFISEYILDVENMNGIIYQNEAITGGTNSSGRNISDYASSNLRNYLKGITVKRDRVYNGDFTNYESYSNGSNVNFFESFKLTEDVLYGKILARSIQDLYATGANNNINELSSIYMGEMDKFWALSYNDVSYITNDDTNSENAIAYGITSGDLLSCSWWLRSPCDKDTEWIYTEDGFGGTMGDDGVGVRPAFALAI